MFHDFILVVVTGLYSFFKAHQTVHLKLVKRIICKFYFNKTNQRKGKRQSLILKQSAGSSDQLPHDLQDCLCHPEGKSFWHTEKC